MVYEGLSVSPKLFYISGQENGSTYKNEKRVSSEIVYNSQGVTKTKLGPGQPSRSSSLRVALGRGCHPLPGLTLTHLGSFGTPVAPNFTEMG